MSGRWSWAGLVVATVTGCAAGDLVSDDGAVTFGPAGSDGSETDGSPTTITTTMGSSASASSTSPGDGTASDGTTGDGVDEDTSTPPSTDAGGTETGAGSDTESDTGPSPTTGGNCIPDEEVCNGQDDDCDDDVDEDDPMLGTVCDTGDAGICAAGTYVCAGAAGLSCEADEQAVAEVCNGLDDDCDAAVDEDCAGTACAEIDIGSASPQTVAGTTLGEDDDFVQTCSNGPDRLHLFTAPSAGSYTFDAIGSAYDTVIAVHADCDGAELACNDDFVGNPLCGGYECSQVTVALQAGQQVIVAMSGFSGASGSYTLNVSGP